MEKHHDYELLKAVEELVDRGFTYIEWDRIYRWFGKERVTAKNYKEFQDIVDEIGGEHIELMCISHSGPSKLGFVVFVRAEWLHNFKDWYQ